MATQQPSAVRGFHTRNVSDITSEEERKLPEQVFPVVRDIVDFGLYKDGNGAFQYHDNLDRVHLAVRGIELGNTEGIRDEKLKLGAQLISDWVLAHQSTTSRNLSFSPKKEGLRAMRETLNALRDAGYDKMPLPKDACGRRLGDGSALLPR